MFAGLQPFTHYQYPVMHYHHPITSKGRGLIKLMILIDARIMGVAKGTESNGIKSRSNLQQYSLFPQHWQILTDVMQDLCPDNISKCAFMT